MSNNSSIIHHPGLFQDQPFLSTDFNKKSGSLRITPSYSGLPALFCEFDKQFDKQELTCGFHVLNKRQDTGIISFKM